MVSYFEKQKQAARTITVSFRTAMTVSKGENRVSHPSPPPPRLHAGEGGFISKWLYFEAGFRISQLFCFTMEVGVTFFVDGPDRFGKLLRTRSRLRSHHSVKFYVVMFRWPFRKSLESRLTESCVWIPQAERQQRHGDTVS